MKIETFLKLLQSRKTDDDKLSLVREHIKNEHVSFSDKVNRADLIANQSYHETITDKNGRKQTKFKQNSAAKYMLYSLSIIDMFTDIEIDFKKSVEQFEKINGELLDLVISVINDKELQEFRMLLDFACDDILVNEYEPHAFIRSQVDRFGGVIGKIVDDMDIDKVKQLVELYNK